MSSRRDFLKQLALALPASYVLPYLTSCSTEDSLFPKGQYKGKVAVIGAGVAGLHATAVLRQHDVDVTLYEAENRIGGRIKSEFPHLPGAQETLLIDGPIELGADLIHGNDNHFYDNVRSFTPLTQLLGKNDKYIIENELRSIQDVEQSAEYKAYLDLKENILASNLMTDQTLESFIGGVGREGEEALSDSSEITNFRRLHRNAAYILGGEIAANYGHISSTITVSEYQHNERHNLRSSRKYRATHDPLFSSLTTVYSNIDSRIQLNSEVKEIDYSGDQIELKFLSLRSQLVDKLIIAVPVSAFSQIKFTPALPAEKLQAISNIHLSPCVKIFMLFKERFWGNLEGTLFPLLPFSRVVDHPNHNVLTFYAYGSEADSLAQLDAAAIPQALDLLDRIYGSQSASVNIQEAKVASWSTHRSEANFVPGAFSYTTPGRLSARDTLAAPLDEKLYFAGEATHTAGHAGTIHGAIETGYIAAHQIFNSLFKKVNS